MDKLALHIEEILKNAAVSKSEAIAEALSGAIRRREMPGGSSLPSVSEAATAFKVARKTIVRAYQKLKMSGYIESRSRIGFFVINNLPRTRIRVMLLIHSFDPHFEVLYNEFSERAGHFCEIDLYFHHYNMQVFELILNRNLANYDFFIISSFKHPQIAAVLSRIPRSKVLIISRSDRLGNSYSSITQDFCNGTYHALKQGSERLKNYHSLVLCYPEPKGHSNDLKEGFEKYCIESGMPFKTVERLDQCAVEKGCAYLVIELADLVRLLKICRLRNWEPGLDIGIISYNETPLKEVIRDGITVISCDFVQMASEMADAVKSGKSVHKIIPISLIIRNSL
jgi:DNA-binding LacI/PurR family transcriptional regulator